MIDLSQHIISGVSLRSRHGCDSRGKHCASRSCGLAIEIFLSGDQTNFLTFHRFFNSPPSRSHMDVKGTTTSKGKQDNADLFWRNALCVLSLLSLFPNILFSCHSPLRSKDTVGFLFVVFIIMVVSPTFITRMTNPHRNKKRESV